MDTHKRTHTAAVVTPTGAVVAQVVIGAETAGYRQLLRFARQAASGQRLWAIEGTGSYGSGLTAHLLKQGERVVEIDRPARPARSNGAKSVAGRGPGVPGAAGAWPVAGAVRRTRGRQ